MSGKPKRKPNPPRRCIFCGGRPISKEHIFAEWLHPYLPKMNVVHHHSRAQMILKSVTREKVRRHSGEPYAGRLKVVCRTCNNEWMGTLQDDTKPFLLPLVQGKNSVLWLRQQKLIAAWATMFTMVTEFYEDEMIYVAVSQHERTWFMEHKLPPRNWRIWIGHYNRGDWAGLWVHASAPVIGHEHVPERTDADIELPNSQSTSFVVGKLYVHVFSSQLSRLVRKQELPDTLMPRLWPTAKTPIIWPPREPLGDAEADGIAIAFAKSVARGRKFLG